MVAGKVVFFRDKENIINETEAYFEAKDQSYYEKMENFRRLQVLTRRHAMALSGTNIQ